MVQLCVIDGVRPGSAALVFWSQDKDCVQCMNEKVHET